MARPSTYEPEIAAAILKDVGAGKTIEAACRCAGIRRTTFLTQVKRHGLASQLAIAKSGKLPEELKSPAAAKKGKGRRTQESQGAQSPTNRPAPAQQESPAVTGTCVWTADDAAFAVVVGIMGEIIDGLRAEYRRLGVHV